MTHDEQDSEPLALSFSSTARTLFLFEETGGQIKVTIITSGGGEVAVTVAEVRELIEDLRNHPASASILGALLGSKWWSRPKYLPG